MIRILDKYGIEVSEKCYVVGKICKTTNKKTGEQLETFQSPSYCTTIEAAVKALRRKLHMDSIKSFDGTLEAAISEIKKLDDRFYGALKEAGLDV